MVDIMLLSIYYGGLNMVSSEGLARECQGSAFCTRSPGLLFGEGRLRVDNRSRDKHLNNHWLSESGCVGN